jgi:hypothetical protein
VTTKGIKVQDDFAMKAMLHRIVAMLTRMAMKFDGVAESSADYDAAIDYDYEHRFAEHEHESQIEEAPEPWIGIGVSLAAEPLPHHPACGSAPGG